MSQSESITSSSISAPMTDYSVRPGVILREIAGEYLLIAVGDAVDICPQTKMINESAAFVWNLLSEGKSTKEIVAAAAEKYGDPPENIQNALLGILGQMLEYKYVIPVEKS